MLTRILFFLYRLCTSFKVLGLKNTLKSLILTRFYKKEMYIKINNKKFFFLPIIHHGSYSRFHSKQYIINDCRDKNHKIKYIVDAGANTGSQAIRFFHHYQYLEKIISIEPDPDNFSFLKKNLNSPKCININAALTSSLSDRVILKTNNYNLVKNSKPTNFSELYETQLSQSGNADYVSSITMNEIVKKNGLSSIDFFKCDLNGFEKEVFKKNLEWISCCKAFAFNNADLNDDIEIIVKTILNNGNFKIFNIDQMIILISKSTRWFAEKQYFKN